MAGDKKEKKGKPEPEASAENAAPATKSTRSKGAKSEAAKAEEKSVTPKPASKKPVVVAGGDDDSAARAQARYVRMAPRKLRLVMDAIRGKSVSEAKGILKFCGKRAAGPLEKVLKSAVANAVNRPKNPLGEENLFISIAFVDQGPSFKSFIPRARGRASAVHKFTSHITIEVKEREEA